MAKEKVKKKLNEFQEIEVEVEKDAREVEKWVLERRRFFIKLGWVILLIVVIIAASYIFTRYF